MIIEPQKVEIPFFKRLFKNALAIILYSIIYWPLFVTILYVFSPLMHFLVIRCFFGLFIILLGHEIADGVYHRNLSILKMPIYIKNTAISLYKTIQNNLFFSVFLLVCWILLDLLIPLKLNNISSVNSSIFFGAALLYCSNNLSFWSNYICIRFLDKDDELVTEKIKEKIISNNEWIKSLSLKLFFLFTIVYFGQILLIILLPFLSIYSYLLYTELFNISSTEKQEKEQLDTSNIILPTLPT